MEIRKIISVVLVLCLVSCLTGQGGTVPVSGSYHSATSTLAPFASAAEEISSPDMVMHSIMKELRENPRKPVTPPETALKQAFEASKKKSLLVRAISYWSPYKENLLSEIKGNFVSVLGGGFLVLILMVVPLIEQWTFPVGMALISVSLSLAAVVGLYFKVPFFRYFSESFLQKDKDDEDEEGKGRRVTFTTTQDDNSRIVHPLVVAIVATVGFIVAGALMSMPILSILFFSVLVFWGAFALGRIGFLALWLIYKWSPLPYSLVNKTAAPQYSRKQKLLDKLTTDKNAYADYYPPSFPLTPEKGVPTDADIEGYIRQIMEQKSPSRVKDMLREMGPGIDRYIDVVISQEPIHEHDLYHLRLLNFCVLVSYWHNSPEFFENKPKIFLDLFYMVMSEVDLDEKSDTAFSSLKYSVKHIKNDMGKINNEHFILMISHEIGHNLQPGHRVMDREETYTYYSVGEVYGILTEMVFAKRHGLNPDMVFEYYEEYLTGTVDISKMLISDAADIPHSKAIWAIYRLLKLGYDPHELLMSFRGLEREYELKTVVKSDFSGEILLLDAA